MINPYKDTTIRIEVKAAYLRTRVPGLSHVSRFHHNRPISIIIFFVGVIVCGRAAFAEICDDTNQAIGVSLVFTAWNAAIVIGPALGGMKRYINCPYKEIPVFTFHSIAVI